MKKRRQSKWKISKASSIHLRTHIHRPIWHAYTQTRTVHIPPPPHTHKHGGNAKHSLLTGYFSSFFGPLYVQSCICSVCAHALINMAGQGLFTSRCELHQNSCGQSLLRSQKKILYPLTKLAGTKRGECRMPSWVRCCYREREIWYESVMAVRTNSAFSLSFTSWTGALHLPIGTAFNAH